ncbi:MAG: hypothetical protein AAB409_03275 [Gemmatimonadota bacterium]
MRRLAHRVFASAALVASSAIQARAQHAGMTADVAFSPDSSYVARVYLPAATDSSTLVREFRVDVRRRSAAFAPTGDYLFAMRGRAAPALEWRGPFTLRVTYAPSAQLLRELYRYDSVAMDYRPSHVEFPRTGLWDAHAHVSWYGEAALDSLTAYGIVAVRDCGGDPVQLRRWRDEIATGQRRGPRIYFSGPAIDGPKNARYRLIVRTPEEGRRAVDSLAALGVSFIKTHNALSPATYFAVLREARRRGLRVASHLPRGVPAWEAADSGAASLEHAAESLLASPIYAGYASDVAGAVAWWRSPAGDSAIGHLQRTGVAVTPTLVAYRAFAGSAENAQDSAGRYEVLAFLEELTGRLYRAGIPIMAGSDFAGPESPLVPGRSLRDELDLLVDAGLTPQAAVATATTVPATWMKGP